MSPKTMKQPEKSAPRPADPDVTINVAIQIYDETLEAIGRTISPGRYPPTRTMPAAEALVDGFLATIGKHGITLSEEERDRLLEEAEKLQVEYGIRDFIGNLIALPEPSRRISSSALSVLQSG